jgi:hypothetical protein
MLSSFDLERETITKGTEEKKIGNPMKKSLQVLSLVKIIPTTLHKSYKMKMWYHTDQKLKDKEP